MANLNAPKGFVPIADPFGNEIPTHKYDTGATAVIYPGQILYLADTGKVVVWTGTATGRTSLVGAAVEYKGSTDSDRNIAVADSPNQEFEAQLDDNTVTALTDFIGANFQANVTVITSVSAARLLSLASLNGASASSVNNSTTIRPFQAIRYREGAENVLAQSYADIVVRIRPENHVFGTAAGVL